MNKLGRQSRLWLSFSLDGFKNDPSEITKILKIEPDHTQIAGEKIVGMRVNARFNQWSLKLESKSHDLEALMDSFIKRFKGRSLSKVAKGIDAGVTAVLEVVGDDTRPSVTLRPDQVEWLAENGLAFGVSYYFFSKSPKAKSKKTTKSRRP